MSSEEMARSKAHMGDIHIVSRRTETPARPADASQSGGPSTPEQIQSQFRELEGRLNAADIQTAADAKKLVTSQDRKTLLNYLLSEVDQSIEQAKRVVQGNAVLGRKTMGQLIGITAETKVYHLPLIAAEGHMMPSSDVRAMRVEDYLRQVLDYDLSADTKRAPDLRRLTNMLG